MKSTFKKRFFRKNQSFYNHTKMMLGSLTRCRTAVPSQMFIRAATRFNSTTSSNVQLIESLNDFKKTVVDKSNEKLKMVDFYATWCGPCKAISPMVEKWADEYKESADFYKIDVDQAPEVAGFCGVSAMPTFLFVKDGKIVSKVVGANPKNIKRDLDLFTK